MAGGANQIAIFMNDQFKEKHVIIKDKKSYLFPPMEGKKTPAPINFLPIHKETWT